MTHGKIDEVLFKHMAFGDVNHSDPEMKVSVSYTLYMVDKNNPGSYPPQGSLSLAVQHDDA